MRRSLALFVALTLFVIATASMSDAQQPPTEQRTIVNLPGMSCSTSLSGRVCKPERGVFIWCETAAELKAIEIRALNNRENQDREIQAEILRSSCRTSSTVSVDDRGDPVRVLDYEDVDRPQVSKIVFANTNYFAPCQSGSYCAVRPYQSTWACPNALDLDQTDRQKLNSNCIRLESGEAQWISPESPSDRSLVEFYIGEGSKKRVYARRISLRAIKLNGVPRNKERGWCKIGEWCETITSSMFCKQQTSLERILATAPGRLRDDVIATERTCQVVTPGNPLKVRNRGNSSAQIVEVGHPGLGQGYISAAAFRSVSERAPLVVTGNINVLVLHANHAPPSRAIALRGQGTSQAAIIFSLARQDATAYCSDYEDVGTKQFLACRDGLLKQSANQQIARADCPSKILFLNNSIFKLSPRPREYDDVNYRGHRDFIWKNVASDQYISTTLSDGEVTIDSAFNALCPSVNSDADKAIVYRDPTATFPREIQGLWVLDKQVCAIYRRNPADTDGQGLMTIGDREVVSYEAKEQLNQLRRDGKAWEADVSWEAEDEAGQNLVRYTLSPAGLEVRSMNGTSRWIRCPSR